MTLFRSIDGNDPGAERPPEDWGRSPLLILGMHRSGTSFLAGTLQAAGLDLGSPSTFDKHNQRGNRELRPLMMFHEEMLKARGHAWDHPPVEQVIWTEEERAEGMSHLSWAGQRPWGFKDPRTLFLIEGWLDLFPAAKFIGIFRHPVAVARSMAIRNRFEDEQSWDLWARYNRRLLALHERHPFPLLCFDEDDATIHHRLDGLLPNLGLSPMTDGEVFFTPELKHHDVRAEPLPSHLQDIYEALRVRQC